MVTKHWKGVVLQWKPVSVVGATKIQTTVDHEHVQRVIAARRLSCFCETVNGTPWNTFKHGGRNFRFRWLSKDEQRAKVERFFA